MFETTLKFSELIKEEKNDEVRTLVENMPAGPERDGLMGYLYYYGIGGKKHSLKMAYVMFERGIKENDSMSLYMLGLMCERAETPDQAEGGPRQKYDHYDAERFMDRCAKEAGIMGMAAELWLGEYYLDSAQGGDPEIGLEYLEKVAAYDSEDAVNDLVDYYRQLAEWTDGQDEEVNQKLLKWQEKSYELNPENESFNLGILFTGIPGIEKDIPRALKLFEDDYNFGHAQGAQALSAYYKDIAEDVSLSPQERTRAAFTGAQWKERAEKNIFNDDDPEQLIEED